MRSHRLSVAAAASLAFAASQAATVNLQPYVDSDLSTYTSGEDYPTGSTTIGGISFAVASFGSGAGAIQLQGAESHTIAVNQTDVGAVYVIINSAWGTFGALNGALVFDNGAGASLTVNLIQGTNIRDHWTSYNNIATDVFATATYDGGNRFDVYRYDLSPLGGTVASVTFASTNASTPGGAPFLAAITTAPVPEPAAWVLMACGLGLLANRRWAAGPAR